MLISTYVLNELFKILNYKSEYSLCEDGEVVHPVLP